EEIADIVGAVLGEAFGAVAALEQKSFAGGDLRQRALEIARLAGEHQRRDRGSRASAAPAWSARNPGSISPRSAAWTLQSSPIPHPGPSQGHDLGVSAASFAARPAGESLRMRTIGFAGLIQSRWI